MALTATATPTVREEVTSSLLMERYATVCESPDRRNVKLINLHVPHKDPYNNPESMSWIVQKLKVIRENYPRTIIYCRSHAQCHSLYGIFESEIGQSTGLFAMYHGSTNPEVQRRIVNDFEKSDGIIRVLFSTVAFGMGVDVKGVHTVIHMGVPPDVDDFVQESGRAGRDGEQAVSVMLLYPRMYRGTRVHQLMKDYAQNKDECRRVMLMRAFGFEFVDSPVKHACCDVCTPKCQCDFDSYVSCAEEANVLAHFGFDEVSDDEAFQRRLVDAETRERLHQRLIEYRESALQTDCSRFLAGKDLASGIPLEFINEIVLQSDIVYPSLELFLKRYPFYDSTQGQIIWEILDAELGQCPILEVDISPIRQLQSQEIEGNDSDDEKSNESSVVSDDSEIESDEDERRVISSDSDDI